MIDGNAVLRQQFLHFDPIGAMRGQGERPEKGAMLRVVCLSRKDPVKDPVCLPGEILFSPQDLFRLPAHDQLRHDLRVDGGGLDVQVKKSAQQFFPVGFGEGGKGDTQTAAEIAC